MFMPCHKKNNKAKSHVFIGYSTRKSIVQLFIEHFVELHSNCMRVQLEHLYSNVSQKF